MILLYPNRTKNTKILWKKKHLKQQNLLYYQVNQAGISRKGTHDVRSAQNSRFKIIDLRDFPLYLHSLPPIYCRGQTKKKLQYTRV